MARGRIVILYNPCHNTEAGPKYRQDWEIACFRAPLFVGYSCFFCLNSRKFRVRRALIINRAIVQSKALSGFLLYYFLVIVDTRLDKLSDHIDALAELVRKLRSENQSLKVRETELNAERARLYEKNQEAKQRLESIIVKLRQGGEQS